MKKLVLTILAVPLLVAAGCAPGSDDIEEPGSSKSDVAQEATYEEPEMITIP